MAIGCPAPIPFAMLIIAIYTGVTMLRRQGVGPETGDQTCPHAVELLDEECQSIGNASSDGFRGLPRILSDESVRSGPPLYT